MNKKKKLLKLSNVFMQTEGQLLTHSYPRNICLWQMVTFKTNDQGLPLSRIKTAAQNDTRDMSATNNYLFVFNSVTEIHTASLIIFH